MSSYNSDEICVPSWLNTDFFKEVICKHHNKTSIEVINLELSPATLKGDHYASVMFRAKIDYEFSNDNATAQKSLIIKTIPEEEGKKRELLSQGSFFETEIGMYTKTLPKIQQILAEHEDETIMAPNLIYCSLDPHKVIILEDLCASGYTCVRGRWLTENEVQVVYQKIAKLHAVTYMIGHSENHAEVTEYQKGIFNLPGAERSSFLANGIKKLIGMLSEHEELNEYLPKIKALEAEMFEQCRQLFNAYRNDSKDEIFVLNHGDFHLKNMMFKFNNESELEDFQLVDFQLSVYAPSIIDLIYSTYMLLGPELRLKRDELMHFYFTNFLETLKKIQFKDALPKFADFQIATIKYRHFTLLLLSTFLPLFYSMNSQAPDELKDLIEQDKDMHRCPAYVEEVKKLLPIYLKAGYLD